MAGAERAAVSVVRDPLREIDGSALLVGLRSALAWLQANQEQVNDLNVFPVPDGDTGSNMYLTLRSAVEDAQAAPAITSAGSVMRAAAHGSLMGARGNSGVILSQVFRGFAQAVGDRDRLDADAVASALAEAARVAYKAVMKPTEGTILTVVREAAEAARRAAAESDDIRRVLEETVREAHAAVERTTDQLAVLRDAGVVDAGGFGLAVILEGLTRALSDTDGSATLPAVRRRRSGEPHLQAPGSQANGAGGAAPASRTARRRGAAAMAAREEGWGYCTEFIVSGPGLDVDALGKELGELGESALVVGDSDLARVHIHTRDPAGLISVASQRGRLSNLKVEDMTAQHHELMARADKLEAVPAVRDSTVGVAASPKRLGVVAVAPGEGFREIFRSLGADVVVEGGQTMNPSIEDLLNGVRAANAERVILLPNNGNVILTAEQVDPLAEGCEVRVVPTRNLPQGISALLAFDPAVSLEENVERMQVAVAAVRAVEVTHAVRDSSINGHDIKLGNVIAVVDDVITQVGDEYLGVIDAVLKAQTEKLELVTVYRGDEVSEADAEALVEALRGSHPAVEFELQAGGQEHYPYVLSLE